MRAGVEKSGELVRAVADLGSRIWSLGSRV